MDNIKLRELIDQPREQYKGFTLVGFVGEVRDEFLQRLERSMKGADKINTPECYLDHQMLGSGISVTPKPLMAYSVQNGFENVEEANEKRNEKFSEVKFSRTYDWGRFFNPGPDGIVALDEALREYDSETNRLMQKYTSGWERQSIDQSIPWPVANEEEYGPEWYGITRGLDFLDFFLQVTPYNTNTGLANHPTVRKIVVNNPVQSGPCVEPLGIITDREALDKIPFIRTYDAWGHILEPTQEDLTIYNGKLIDKN